MDLILEWDYQIFLLLNNLGMEPMDNFWLILTEKWTSIPLYVFLLFLIKNKMGWVNCGIFLLFVILFVFLSDQLSNISKDYFQRLRPCDTDLIDQGRYIAKRCGKFGFFSAHASSTFGLAILVGMAMKPHYPKLIFWLILWSVVISYSRIYIGVHYPTDLIVGWFVGSVLAISVFLLHQRVISRYHESTPKTLSS